MRGRRAKLDGLLGKIVFRARRIRAQLELLRAIGATCHRCSNLSRGSASSCTRGRGECRGRRAAQSGEPPGDRAAPGDDLRSSFSPGSLIWAWGTSIKLRLRFIMYYTEKIENVKWNFKTIR